MTNTFDYQLKETLSYQELANRANVLSSHPEISSKGSAQDFFVFQITDKTDGEAAVMLSDLEPAFTGEDGKPDVLMEVNLVHFNFPATDEMNMNRKTRATMRLNIEQKVPVNDKSKPLVWIATAGIKIHDLIKEGRNNLKDEKLTDFNKSFGNRAIEIPKGKVKLSFDVLCHKEPKWYEKVFSFASSPTGGMITAALGLPGVTTGVIGIIDKLFKDLKDEKSQILFASPKLDLVLNQAAKTSDEYEDEPVMTPGYFVICRGSDLGFFKKNPARYNGAIKNLLPIDVKVEDFLTEGYTSPFADKTFAIFKVGMQEINLKQNLLYSVGAD